MQYCPLCSSLLTNRIIEGVDRLACSSESCDYVFYDNPTPVVAAIVEYEGKVVLGHKAGWPDSRFGVIAGFLEKGETPEQAVLREVEEEIGLKGEIAGFIGHYSFFLRNQLILAFHVKGEGAITLGTELDEVKLVLPEALTPWSQAM